MERKYNFVVSDGKLTLEQLDQEIEVSKEDCRKYYEILCKNLLDIEKEVYRKVEEELDNKIKLNEASSRRVIIAHAPTDSNSDWCLTSIHLLFREQGNLMTVYHRSMSNAFFASDISFYSKLAAKYNADLKIIIGSSHFIMGKVD